MREDAPGVRADGLTKRFGETIAVDDVTFEVRRGEALGLLGRNGAGKTTVVRMLTTLLTPSAGRAFVAGYEVSRRPRSVRARIGAVCQAATVDLDLSGFENLDVYGQLYGVPRRVRRARARELLARVGLDQRANDLVATYSGGMRRRLEIARGLMHAPEVLFLDEPTVGLDLQSRRVVWGLLTQLRTQGPHTMLLATHAMDEAEQLCDRIAILDAGRLVALGTPSVLKSRIAGSDRIDLEVEGDVEAAAALVHRRRGVRGVKRVGATLTIAIDDGSREIPRLVKGIESSGARVLSVRAHRTSLEDVFVHFTGSALREERARKLGFDGGPPGASSGR